MRRVSPLIVLAAIAVGSLPTVSAGLPFFSRRDSQDRRQPSDARREREVRFAQGPGLLAPFEFRPGRVFFQVPPAPAGEPALPPLPDARGSLPTVPMDPLPSGPIELYPRVEYDDRDDAHPHGVRRLVAVKDPRSCRKPCDCCDSRLVFVEVCVPPHGIPKVKVSKDGRKIDFDYGEYEIEIESKDRKIEVEYED